jgi:hypothetical protein
MQEHLVMKKEDLAAPCGVSFDVPGDKYGERANNIKSWNEAVQDLGHDMDQGWFVMVLIQTRNVRVWQPLAKRFAFKPAQDILAAAYIVHPDIVATYVPGTVLNAYFGVYVYELGTVNIAKDKIIKKWKVGEKTSQLTDLGAVKMLWNFLDQKPQVEAISLVKDSFVDGMKYGWRGTADANRPKPPVGFGSQMGRGRGNNKDLQKLLANINLI